MARRLVLVRHAKTESRKEGLPDLERALTKPGKRSCKARLPKALRLLDCREGEELQVWSSPARRALQTAKVAAHALGLSASDIQVHDSLYAEDPSRFLRELKEAAGTVVVVGHNPFIEELFRSFTGYAQPFEKCACASFAFADVGHPSLEWFVQGPDSKRWKVLIEAEKVLKANGRRVREARAAFLANPLDEETLHQYRISLRRTRSIVQFLAPYLKADPCSCVEEDLKLLARETSRLRELDVFICELAARKPAGPEEGRAALAAELERNRLRGQLVDSLLGRADKKRLSRLKRFCAKPAWKHGVEAQGLAADALSRRFRELAAACKDELASCDFADCEQTHDLRKRFKRLRYAARELEGLLDEASIEAGGSAHALQDRLGEVCDARVNAGLAAEFDDAPLLQEQSERARALVAELQHGARTAR